MKILGLILPTLLFLTSCGHIKQSRLGFVSIGELEGKRISRNIKGKMVNGKSCGWNQSLSKATRNALEESELDTIINPLVTVETGLFVFNNCVTVSGKAVNSKKL